MNFKRTIISLLVLAVLVSFYLIDSAKKERDEETGETLANLANIESGSITEIRLSRDGREILFVKDKKSSDWIIDDAFEGRIKTDSGTIATLIENLGDIRKTESLGEVSNIGKYGLSVPRIIIRASDGKDEETFRLGKKTPTDEGVYLMKNGDKKLYVAESSLFSAADKDLYDFRDKKMLNVDPDKISAFSFTESGKTFSFEKKDDSWMLTANRKYRADDNAVKGMLNSLTSAEVKEFIKPEKDGEKVRGFDKTALRITLKVSTGKELKLLFGRVKPSGAAAVKKDVPAAPSEPEKIYARSSGIKSDLLVEKTVIANLKSDLKMWKSRKIMDVHFDSINDTRIMGPEKMVAFRRSGKDESQFEIYEPERMRASHWECNSLNSRIANISAAEFLKPTAEMLKKAQFGKPYTVITFKTGKNKLNPNLKEVREYSIVIGAAGKTDETEGHYVRVSDNNEEIYFVSNDILKEVIKTPFDLREKELIHVRAEQVNKITINIEMNKKPAEILIEKDYDKWEVSEPRELRDKNVDDILWDIMSLKMDGTAVKPANLSDYGLKKPFAVITLYLEDDKIVVIKIGSLIPGDNPTQNYVMIEDDKNIYITSTALRNVISGIIEK
jgi:hypothetical protein